MEDTSPGSVTERGGRDCPPVSAWVVIPTYQGREEILACLASLHRSDCPPRRVVVVDNASTDGTADEVVRCHPEVEVLRQGRNLGFGGGCNEGIERALAGGADYILLLNQDTRVAPDAIRRLVSFMENRPAAALVGPRTRSLHPLPDGRPRLLYAGSWRTLLPLRQRVPGIERPDGEEEGEPRRVDYVWGHAMMLRARALHQVGPFDPRFFMYFEDLDLCRRMAAAGGEIWCLPGALVWHDAVDGARALHSEYWRWAHKVDSVYLFHRKYKARLAAVTLSALTLLAEVGQLARQGKWRACGHLLRAWLGGAFRRRT